MSGSAASIPTDSSRIAPSGADTTLTESKLNPALSSKRWTLEPVEYDGTLCARNQAGLIVIPVDKDSRFRGKSKAMNATHGESVIRHRVLRLVCKKGNKYPFVRSAVFADGMLSVALTLPIWRASCVFLLHQLSNQALRQELANFRFTISWQSQPTIDGGVLGAGVEAIGFECGSLRRVKNCVKLHLTALVDIVGVCASPVLELLIEESDGVTWWVNQRMALNFVWKSKRNYSIVVEPCFLRASAYGSIMLYCISLAC